MLRWTCNFFIGIVQAGVLSLYEVRETASRSSYTVIFTGSLATSLGITGNTNLRQCIQGVLANGEVNSYKSSTSRRR